MRVPHAATLWNYGKRPAIALLEAMIAEREEARAKHAATYPRETGTNAEKDSHILVSIARVDFIRKLERRLQEVQKWPDAP